MHRCNRRIVFSSPSGIDVHEPRISLVIAGGNDVGVGHCRVQTGHAGDSELHRALMKLTEIADTDIYNRAGIDHAAHRMGLQQIINIVVFPNVARRRDLQAAGANRRGSIRRCVEPHAEVGKLFRESDCVRIVIVFHGDQNAGRYRVMWDNGYDGDTYDERTMSRMVMAWDIMYG